MILIVVTFPLKPEHADAWPKTSRDFTEATRAEPGNLWFEWSRSVEDPSTYVLVEAFEDDAAEAHVSSPHFRAMQEEFPRYLAATPRIISRQVDGDGWEEMSELQVGRAT